MQEGNRRDDVPHFYSVYINSPVLGLWLVLFQPLGVPPAVWIHQFVAPYQVLRPKVVPQDLIIRLLYQLFYSGHQ